MCVRCLPATSSQIFTDIVKASTLEKDCAVCKEQFKLETEDPDEQVVVTLPCNHPFHEPCITPWLKSSGTCPVCRWTRFSWLSTTYQTSTPAENPAYRCQATMTCHLSPPKYLPTSYIKPNDPDNLSLLSQHLISSIDHMISIESYVH